MLSLTGIFIMTNETTLLKKKYKFDLVCPSPEVTKEDAWKDQIRPVDKRIGYMSCYCEPLIGVKGYTMSFEEYTLPNGKKDMTKYCREWLKNYVIQNGMVIGMSILVVVINIITC
jgi:hypothetical protein